MKKSLSAQSEPRAPFAWVGVFSAVGKSLIFDGYIIGGAVRVGVRTFRAGHDKRGRTAVKEVRAERFDRGVKTQSRKRRAV